jgi:hypothetical protein
MASTYTSEGMLKSTASIVARLYQTIARLMPAQ